MTPERWQRIEQLLHGALEREPAERAALLERACEGDPNLREEVETLLASAEAARSFLNGKALEDAATFLREAAPESIIGQQIGPYLVEKQLGVGGMGEVYLARDGRLGRNVALKLLDPGLTHDRATRMRFLREARLASALDHPNTCTIHEVGEAKGRMFIAMQYVEGETLTRLIKGRPLPLDSLLSISLQIADALAAAHARGIIHRDIKSGNIIITPQGQAKVLDFGLAKLLEREDEVVDTRLTMRGVVMGTPASMSPEQARGEPTDHRTDVFSFGVVMYEMATGHTPFKGRSHADVISAVIHQPHTLAAELNNEIPMRLSALIDRALAKRPDDRYQSIQDIIAELTQVIAEAGGLAQLFSTSDPARGRVPLVPVRRLTTPAVFGYRISHPLALVLSVITIAALIGVGLVIYASWKQRSLSAAQNNLDQQAAAPPFQSIAVLPFKPLVAGSRDEALEMGMADTLINKLSSMQKFIVRPISAVRKYAGIEQDAVAAGREQKVNAVLDGSIQRSADKIRVTVRLLKVEDGSQVWSESFDEKFTDIFAVQDRVSEKVVTLLSVKLSGQEQMLLTKHSTDDAEAYELYLKGRYHLNRLTDDGFLKGRDYFQQAINKDERYALAYAGLADAYNRLSGWNVVSPSEGFPHAKVAALKALEFDKQLAEAHTQLGAAKLLYEWDFAGAENEFKQAIEINRSDGDAHYVYGYHLSAMGRFNEALEKVKRAHELDPLSLEKLAGIGDVFYQHRDYDEAMAHYQKALEMDPNSGFAHWALGNVYVQKRMYAQAIEEYQKAIPLSGDSPDEPGALAYAYALSGKTREARRLLEDLKERSKRRYVSPTIIAFIYAALRENDEAFAWLDKAYEGRDFMLVLLKVEPMFDPLRSDPRFKLLLKSVGFES